MAEAVHPSAVEHFPVFITEPGQTDYLFIAVIIFMLASVLIVGNLYFQLHALPERRAHHTSKVQMEIVAVLALISLFTHNHLFWIAGLLLAFVQIPDFSTPLYSIAQSLAKLSGRSAEKTGDDALLPADEPQAEPPQPPTKNNEQGLGI